MWVTKLLISPVKKRKKTKFGPKLAFLVNLGQAMQAYSVPCWWVGWWLWRPGCISQDTYLLYQEVEEYGKGVIVSKQYHVTANDCAYQALAGSARARRACALRALGLLLAD